MTDVKQMIKPEILAPAGGIEQLEAAVRCGADAVYLGTNGFNARQNAQNFSDSELADAVSYCHARNVAVHVTLNTLAFDDELKNVARKAETIAKCGVDAVIIQDLAAAKIIRECCPQIAMHASTQMTIHNTAGALAAKKLGFTRVVLARELSLEEIENVARAAEIETEVFIHGALCTCVSGACYLSAMLGGRSGNRGYCAQPCRLNFINGQGREYALSLKDMSLIEYTDKLTAAGVASLKIEGRMKRPEYVAAAVTALRTALDGGQPDMTVLEKAFSRSGFTSGYLTGKRNVLMYGYRRKEDVEASSEVLSGLRSLYRNERQSVPTDMRFTAMPGKRIELNISDGANNITEFGEIPEEAINKAIDAEYVRRFLTKTGGTPFYVNSTNIKTEGEISLSGARLNCLRRAALDNLLKTRSVLLPSEFKKADINIKPHAPGAKTLMRMRFEKYEQATDFVNAEKIILPISEILANKDGVKRFGEKLMAEVPALIWEKETEKLFKNLQELKDIGVFDVVCSNIGAIYLAKSAGLIAHGGYGLNILNSLSLAEYEALGLTDATLSFEMGINKIKSLGENIKRGVIAYGYLPLMKLRVCPAQGPKGCAECDGKQYLIDRKGIKFPLLCKNKQYTELLNSVPLYIGDKNISFADFAVLYFTVEDRETIASVVNKFIKKEKYEGGHTNGLYYRDIL